MTGHCGYGESPVVEGQICGSKDWVSVCLEPGLHYGFRYGAPGRSLKVSFSVDSLHARGSFDWERFGRVDWASLELSFNQTNYTLWISRSFSPDDAPRGLVIIKDQDHEMRLDLEPASIYSTLPFD